MWSAVLGVALVVAFHPVRLGVILLVISRRRPVQNLLAYSVGSLMVPLTYLLVPLLVFHITGMFSSFTKDITTPGTVANSTVRHFQIGIGVLVLSIAALMTVRLFARQRARLPTQGANTSTLVPDSNTPPAISRLLGHAQTSATEGGSAIRRLLGRAYNAWENGSLWVASVIGFVATSPDTAIFVLAVIVTSGAAIGTQVSAAIVFMVVGLAVVEITLAGYLVRPAKAQSIVRLLHDWARAHRRKILIAILAVVGVVQVAHGMGSV